MMDFSNCESRGSEVVAIQSRGNVPSVVGSIFKSAQLERADCPACGSTKRKFWLIDRNRRNGLDIECDAWRCGNCATIYLSPVPDFDDAVLAFNQHAVEPKTMSLPMKAVNRIVDIWASMWSPGVHWRGEPRDPGRGRRLLSIGSSYGTALRKYADAGWHVTGVDPNPAAIAWSRAHIPGDYYTGLFEDVEIDGQFDFIHCSAVIEHVADPVAFIAKAGGLLKPGGRLLFTTPNGGGAMTRMLKGYSIASWVPFHVVLFTQRGLGLAARRAGLTGQIHSVADPHLASLSIRQWRLRNAAEFSLEKSWDTRGTTLLLAPIWAALNQFGLGEDLVLEATKS